MSNPVSPRPARSNELSLFQMRINEGKEAMRRAKKGGNPIAKLAKQIRALKIPPPGATPDNVESAYFVIGHDAANAVELVVALLRRNANCINDQALIMLIASIGHLNETLHELRPNVIQRARELIAANADTEIP